MSRSKTEPELIVHKDSALNEIDRYLNSLIKSEDSTLHGKADKISYWLEDYMHFLDYETSFDVSKYPKYKKGQIVKVHLGFNIGSEEGGLHYAIVIENNNSVRSPVLNIVPLTSVKESSDISKIRPDLGQVYLGNELYRLINSKISTLRISINDEIANLKRLISELFSEESETSKVENMNQRIKKLEKQVETLNKANKEISKMKIGSIALVGQITTVSKIRIYDPKNTNGVLSQIRLSNETLDKIDDAIRQLFTKII